MKTYIAILISIILLIGSTSPALAYAHQSHGTHGLGNVNQNFVGVDVPPPWDLPPGLLH